MSGFPETSGFAMVLKRAGQALVLSGESARQAGSILETWRNIVLLAVLVI